MARLYAEQGYLRKAAEIYRYLLRQNPDRTNLQQALASVEERIAEQQTPSRKELALLMREWYELIGVYRRLKKTK